MLTHNTNHKSTSARSSKLRRSAILLILTMSLAQPTISDVIPVAKLLKEDSANFPCNDYYSNNKYIEKNALIDLAKSYIRISTASGIKPILLFDTSSEVNAYATIYNNQPIIAFTKGILCRFAGQPDAIAAVLGHEFAHLKLNHSKKSSNTEVALSIASVLIGAALDYQISKKSGQYSDIGQQLTGFGANLISKKFSRDQEIEADEQGLIWAMASGYNPSGALLFHKTLNSDSSWFSTHPSSQERIEKIEAITKDKWLTNKTTGKNSDKYTSIIVFTDEEIREINQKALLGNPRAKAALGAMLQYGWSVEANPELGAKWLKSAANDKDVYGQMGFGVALLKGLGVEQNTADGIKTLGEISNESKLAKIVFAIAKKNHANPVLSFLKIGDDPLAELKSLAEHGDHIARIILGGSLIKKDPQLSNRYLKLSADDGSVIAKLILGSTLISKKDNESKKSGMNLIQESAAKGSKTASFIMSYVYFAKNKSLPDDVIQHWEQFDDEYSKFILSLSENNETNTSQFSDLLKESLKSEIQKRLVDEMDKLVTTELNSKLFRPFKKQTTSGN